LKGFEKEGLQSRHDPREMTSEPREIRSLVGRIGMFRGKKYILEDEM